MPSRLIALTLALTLALAAVATAATTRTSATPDILRAEHTSYEQAITKSYSLATKMLDTQLARHPKKPTVVLDVDETTLSNWTCLDAVDFNLAGLATCVVTSKSIIFPAAKKFLTHARAKHVAIAFITGAPQAACALRKKNLTAQGVKQPFTLTCRPATDTKDSVAPYKTAARKKIIKSGRTILLNIGDQRSDLSGGAARETYKLPNPIYTVG